MKNKIALTMLIAMTSILTTTSIVYASFDQDFEIYDQYLVQGRSIVSGDHSLLMYASGYGWNIFQNNNMPLLSHTWEHSYSGLFDDIVSETIIVENLEQYNDGYGNYNIYPNATITNLEAGHEYSIRMFGTNEAGNSDYSNTVTGIPASGNYTFTVDSIQYEDGTELQPLGVVQTNSTIFFYGTILKNNEIFEHLDITVVFDSITESTITFPIISLETDGTWFGSVLVDFPISWDPYVGDDTELQVLYADEFGNLFAGLSGFTIDYEFIISEGQCPEGYEPEIIDEEGNFICNVTNEWHESEMERMQGIIDYIKDMVLLGEPYVPSN